MRWRSAWKRPVCGPRTAKATSRQIGFCWITSILWSIYFLRKHASITIWNDSGNPPNGCSRRNCKVHENGGVLPLAAEGERGPEAPRRAGQLVRRQLVKILV